MILKMEIIAKLNLFHVGDQEMNHTILEMACAFKIESRRFRLKNSQKESRVTDDNIFVSMVTDLHKRHSDECEERLEKILDMVSSTRLYLGRKKLCRCPIFWPYLVVGH